MALDSAPPGCVLEYISKHVGTVTVNLTLTVFMEVIGAITTTDFIQFIRPRPVHARDNGAFRRKGHRHVNQLTTECIPAVCQALIRLEWRTLHPKRSVTIVKRPVLFLVCVFGVTLNPSIPRWARVHERQKESLYTNLHSISTGRSRSGIEHTQSLRT